MSDAQAFPWEDAMVLGLNVLRWTPSEFWRATPRELMAGWEGLNGRPMTPAVGSDLRRLMEEFPDG
ncbi:phage tail assembly chaperone [Microvirga alba]|nr:phage tail assembly chaperone [Microvirga alba]